MSIKLSQSDYNKIFGKNTPLPKSKKQNKYKNKKPVINGIKYDSLSEYERHQELLLLEKAGIISNVEYHLKKNLIILQENPSIKYEPDFCYYENGKLIIEDVKGFQTKDFKIKMKLIENKINTKEFNFVFRITQKKNNSFVIIKETL